MKKIMNGKTYNTDTAEMLGQNTDNFSWCERLYRTPKGAYFFYEKADGKERMWTVAENEAKAWVEQYFSAELYIEYFGEPEAA